MIKDQLKAYQSAQRQNMTPRELEAMAFTKAAQMLDDAKNTASDDALFAQALRFNNLLWTIMQADIIEPENKLPNEIKANIMSLSLFVDRQTTRAIRSKDRGDLEVLISINRNLAMGLRETPPVATDDEVAQP